MGPDTRAGTRVAPDEVASFLARLTGLLLRSSGEGAVLIERTVRHTARALGADASVLLVPDGAALTVGSLGMRGLTTLAGGYVTEGFRDLLKLVTIVTAIAVGLVLGAVLAQPAVTSPSAEGG
ncbi:hypothetical protein ACLQ18_05980 [Streptomyces sp. DT193]|uniref:hypothetical protein n=1 Tax=Streptomyces sp. DT193 TaxID=3393418 RepID=UPI003CF32C49